MYRPLLLASLGLLIAAPAQAQRLTGDRSIDYGGVVIPATQAKSPAGDDRIAFRPACRQLEPYVDPESNLVNWGLRMPDGRQVILYNLDNLPEQQAHLELQAAGICKFGTQADGVVDVPIIYTADLPVEVIAQPTADTTGNVEPTAVVGQPNSIRNLLLMGIAAAGLVGMGWVFMHSRDSTDAPPKPKQANDNDPFGHI